MLKINTQAGAKPVPVEREPLVTIDGAELTIPKRFLPTDMLQYLHILQTAGPDAAGKWALHYSLGDTGFWKLIDAGPYLDENDLAKMITCVTSRMLGLDAPVPGPKADPENAPDSPDDSIEEPPDSAVWPEQDSAPATEQPASSPASTTRKQGW